MTSPNNEHSYMSQGHVGNNLLSLSLSSSSVSAKAYKPGTDGCEATLREHIQDGTSLARPTAAAVVDLVHRHPPSLQVS